MKQTSIEWLEEKIKRYSLDLNTLIFFDEAKEMHKQEIIDAIVQYQIKHNKIFSEQGILNVVNNAEQYYNETYNN